MPGEFNLMRRVLIFLFMCISSFGANAMDAVPSTGVLDMSTKLQFPYKTIAPQLQSIFMDSTDTDKFLQFIISKGYYDKKSNVIFISALELGIMCNKYISEYNLLGNTYNDNCANVSYEIFKDRVKSLDDEAMANNGKIYAIFASEKKSNLQSVFRTSLSNYIFDTYCASRIGANIDCKSGGATLQCEINKSVKYLPRDLRLYCDESNWYTYKMSNGYYGVQLKKPRNDYVQNYRN